jgi:protein-L-isoaspartate(D-aspartate) O-methyltransferase
MDSDILNKKREQMIESQIKARGIEDENLLEAMRKIPRHAFVPSNMQEYAYNDEPLPIGGGQTISQPYIVAYMTNVLGLKKGDKVLEIGTGSGYQAALLAEMAEEVYTVEIHEDLAQKARKILDRLGYDNIHYHIGDGTQGWTEHAPYDAIMVTAAPSKIPEKLKEQMKIGAKMVIPVGQTMQELILLTREEDKFIRRKLLPVRFVPLVSTH